MKNRKKSIEKTAVRIAISGMIVMLTVFILLVFNVIRTRKIVFQYITETAELYCQQISTDILQANYEIIKLLKNNVDSYQKFNEFRPNSTQYYQDVSDLQDSLKSISGHYSEIDYAYLYVEETGTIILNSGVLFPNSIAEGKNLTLRASLYECDGESIPYTQWFFIDSDTQKYVYSRYHENDISAGCLISLDKLFSRLSLDSMGYRAVPLIVDTEQHTVFSMDDAGQIIMTKADSLMKKSFSFFNYKSLIRVSNSTFLGNSRDLYLTVSTTGGSLQWVLILQLASIVVFVFLSVVCFSFLKSYQKRILEPMRKFVGNLKTVSQEQWLNESGSNNLLELEMASEEFRQLLRKIRQLKIRIYEDELKHKETVLEALQLQLHPHFYINCLSIIHGMAELGRKEDIIGFTEILSGYMRHVLRDVTDKDTLENELEYVNKYIQIQKIRYGQDAFDFEIIKEGGVDTCLIPVLLIHNFIANAVENVISLDYKAEITLYIGLEKQGEGEKMYICISDTGKGFPKEILEELQKGNKLEFNGRKHIGILNSMKRLQLMYEERARIQCSNMQENYGAVVEIWLPAERKEEGGMI